jgi:hypothetical protein
MQSGAEKCYNSLLNPIINLTLQKQLCGGSPLNKDQPFFNNLSLI